MNTSKLTLIVLFILSNVYSCISQNIFGTNEVPVSAADEIIQKAIDMQFRASQEAMQRQQIQDVKNKQQETEKERYMVDMNMKQQQETDMMNAKRQHDIRAAEERARRSRK